MNDSSHADPASETTTDRRDIAAVRTRVTLASVATGAMLSLALLSPTAAHAVDGCLVLLCFAAPSWRAVQQCVPPIRQVLRDLARGRGFPTCGMAGASNAAQHAWARAPGNCPPQYTPFGLQSTEETLASRIIGRAVFAEDRMRQLGIRDTYQPPRPAVVTDPRRESYCDGPNKRNAT